jgi:hypothetical protein
MAEFLEVIENIRAESASIGRLFGDAGRSVRSLKRSGPEYKVQLAEAAKLMADAMDGQRLALWTFQEALTTSDFPLLFGDVLDRQLLANYREWPVSYPNYAAVKTVPDFRSVRRFAIDGSEAVLGQVNEQEEYPQSNLSETRYTYAVVKYGRKIPFSWEAMINDDLDALKDIPMRFARAARRTEERFVTDLLFDSNGPDATHVASGNNNILTAALSVAGLQAAFTVLGNQVDADGEPIVIDSAELVVPPALEVVAQNIMNALEIRALTDGGGTSAQTLVAVNWMKNRLRLNVNPYIPIIATTNGDTSWIIVANPSSARPTVEIGFLRGHTEPEIFIKSPNAQRVGGGSAAPFDGDFGTDSIEYKVRHVLGGILQDPKAIVGSNGTT